MSASPALDVVGVVGIGATGVRIGIGNTGMVIVIGAASIVTGVVTVVVTSTTGVSAPTLSEDTKYNSVNHPDIDGVPGIRIGTTGVRTSAICVRVSIGIGIWIGIGAMVT